MKSNEPTKTKCKMAMKNFLTMAALALVGAIMAGCSGSDDIIDDAPQPATQKDNIVTMKTTVGLDGGGETRALSPTGVKTFAVGDQMEVLFTNTAGYRIGLKSHALTAEDITNNGKSATFTFDFVHPWTHCVPDTRENLQYVYPASMVQSFSIEHVVMEELITHGMYGYQDGSLEYLGQELDLTTYEGPWVGDGILPSATLVNQLALLAIKLKDDATDQYITSSLNEVVINIENVEPYVVHSEGDTFGQDVIYVGIYPEDINSKGVFHVTATDGTNFYAKTLTGKSYAKGNGYNITWRMTKVDKKAIPLTMEALSDGTIVVNNPRSGMQYSLNGGTKTTMTTTTTINVNTGDKVQFYGNGKSITRYWEGDGGNYTSITGSDEDFMCKVYGNIMSLVDETDFATSTELSSDVEHTFQYLFEGNTTLIDASGLLLPATELSYYCYAYMFNGCKYLETAPELPAEELTEGCYQGMFQNCTSLTKAPVLPAEGLFPNCYESMFSGCSSLSSVTCLATSGINYLSSTFNWLSGVASGGTFTKAASADVGSGTSGRYWPTNSPNGIPGNWRVEEQ